jgi:hypothetical protein
LATCVMRMVSVLFIMFSEAFEPKSSVCFRTLRGANQPLIRTRTNCCQNSQASDTAVYDWMCVRLHALLPWAQVSSSADFAWSYSNVPSISAWMSRPHTSVAVGWGDGACVSSPRRLVTVMLPVAPGAGAWKHLWRLRHRAHRRSSLLLSVGESESLGQPRVRSGTKSPPLNEKSCR